MQLRTISRTIVIALVALVGAAALIHQQFARGADGSSSAPVTLTSGTPLHTNAPAFSLKDQSGATVSLQSLQGRPFIITFMDMTCTQECPIIAQMIQQTATFLGPEKTSQVNWVIVSVNPNNTPADVTDFMKKNGVTLPVKVLLGTQAELKPVWAKYYIDVQPTPTDVNHTVALFVVDQKSVERLVILGGIDSKALAHDLSTLLTTH
jgi:protein SCO1/2